jgi:PKD repeat protein
MPSAALKALFASAIASLCIAATGLAAPASADTGYRDFSFGSSGALTGNKESKLWYTAGGQWWSILTVSGGGPFHIFKLDRTSHTWSDTGIPVDPSSTTRPDVLFDAASNRLYVGSHTYTASNKAGTTSRLYRFDFNGTTYTPVGSPTTINSWATETMTIDKDSTGQIWATWHQATSIYVNHTVGNDSTWGTPYAIPGASTNEATDDISSIVHFGSNIGVMYSNQTDTKTYFAVHPDGGPDSTAGWSVGVVPTGYKADDHFSLRALPDGTVYAATKTSDNSSSVPTLVLMKRSPAGTWTGPAVFGTYKDSQTRPMIELDPANGLVHMFATGPNAALNTSGQAGGVITQKDSSLGAIGFAPGPGTAVIKDDDSARVNDVTGTKQNVTSTSGMVIEASDKDLDQYWHNELSLGGTPPPPAPSAHFTPAASSTGSLTWNFTNSSTGATSYSWSFGDGSPAVTVTSPSHTYAVAGTYTVTLTASAAGASPSTASQTIVVGTTGGGGGGGTTTLPAIADTHVKSASPANAYGTATTVQTRLDSAAVPNSYLGLVKFDLAGITGTVTSAKLRLFVTDPSKAAGTLFNTGSAWTESVTYNTRPAQGTQIGTLGATVAAGAWEEVDVTAAVSAGGQLSFYLPGGGTDSFIFASREAGAATAPQLVVTTS